MRSRARSPRAIAVFLPLNMPTDFFGMNYGFRPIVHFGNSSQQ